MDPAILNYLQAQNSQSQGTPDNQMQGMGQSASAPQGNYNPFDTGISRAIESARASLGMTQKQQDKALRSSMLAFANNMSQQPKERGFFNNFASVGRALSPALSTYDQEETAALNENNALANQILQYQAQEQQRRALEEQRAWQRQHSEAQLGELKRYHDLMGDLKKQTLESKNLGTNSKHGKSSGDDSLDKILNQAEIFIKSTDKDAHRGNAKRFFNKFVPGGELPLTEEQAEINALGDVLRGKLFNAWGYRNQAEFEHVPSISADYPKETNLAIIKRLKSLLAQANQENDVLSLTGNKEPLLESESNGFISFLNPETNEYFDVPADMALEVENQYPNLVRQ